MLHIAVIEDSVADTKKVKMYIHQYSEQTRQTFKTTFFQSADHFLDKYKPIYDLIFMDIELPDTNGMDAAKKLRLKDPDVTLIFMTNLSSFAVKGYEVNALDYMVKPVNYSMFNMKMQKAVKHIEKMSDSLLNINCKNGIIRMRISKIYYIEVRNHRLIYHTEEGDYDVRGTLKKLEENLIPQHFLRCNNCYLVNLRHITSVQDGTVTVGNDILPISRPKKKNFMDKFTEYLGV